jgi:ABC-type spermidine/putrescine transport system permease subunit II
VRVALWWTLLVAGVALSSVTALGTTRAFADRRVPRLGFWPDLSGFRTPSWIWASLCVGIVLMIVSSDELTSSDGGHWALFGCAAVVGWAVRVAVIFRHNRRVVSTRSSAHRA